MHTPPDMSLWQGRDDTTTEGPEATRLHQCIKPWTEHAPPGVCLLGFACDEGVRRNQGRVGAAEGPAAIRKALANLAWPKDLPVLDGGGVRCVGEDLERAQEELGAVVAKFLRSNQRVITLGGGHETAWGSFLGLTAARPNGSLAVVNLDAHFDVRPGPPWHSGTPFRQMALWSREAGCRVGFFSFGIARSANTGAAFRAAEEFGVVWRTDRDADPWQLVPLLEEFDQIYLSVDVDVLPGFVMPAVSAPAGRGLPLGLVERVIERVAASGRLALADVVEFNPAYDTDGTAVRTAASLVWQLANDWAAAKANQP